MKIKLASNKGVSVVIPNYNGISLFPQTVPALLQAIEFADVDCEIIIVDDCSTDNSVAYLKEKFPEIKVLENEVNKGFSPTINKGIFAAEKDLVFLLNSDVKLEKDYFAGLFKYFEDASTFGVMGRIIDWDGEAIQDGAKFPRCHLFKIKTSFNYTSSQSQTFLPSFYLSGANALIDRSKILQIGGFDELFAPFYIEDVDLSLRAWRMGWKCYYDHQAVCRHRTSSSIKSKDKKRYISKIYNRNKLYFHAVHLSYPMLVGWIFQTLLELVFRLLTFRTDYLQAVSLFIRNINRVVTSRRRIKNEAVLTTSEVINEIKLSSPADKVFFKQ